MESYKTKMRSVTKVHLGYIYVLYNTQTQHYYVGSTRNLESRLKCHKHTRPKYELLELYPKLCNQRDLLDYEDLIALDYMSDFGIDTVQGGKWGIKGTKLPELPIREDFTDS